MPASSLSQFDFSLDGAIYPDPLMVSSQMSWGDLLAMMVHRRKTCDVSQQNPLQPAQASCALVVDDNRLVGVLTDDDVVGLIATRTLEEQVSVSAVITRELISLKRSPSENLFKAIHLLHQYQIRHLPVLSEQDKILGLITVEQLYRCLPTLEVLKDRRVEEAMSREMILTSPQTTVQQVTQDLAKSPKKTIVVTNPQLHPLGVLSAADLVLFYALGLDDQMPVDRIMNPCWQTINPKDRLRKAVDRMQEERLEQLLVSSESGKIVGIVNLGLILQVFDPVEMYKEVQQNAVRDSDLNAAIVDAVSCLVVVLDAQGRIIRFNQSCEAITGYSFLEVRNQAFWEVFLSAEEQQPFRDYFYPFPQGEFPRHLELNWKTKGSVGHLISHLNTTRFNEEGQVEFVILTGEDITHHRQRENAYRHLTEELEQRVHHRTQQLTLEIAKHRCTEIELQWEKARLKSLISSNPAIIYSRNYPSLKTTFISENVYKILGYEPDKFLEDIEFWGDKIHPDDQQCISVQIETILQQGYYCYEYRFRDQKGDYRWMRDEVKLIKDAAGHPVELIGYWIEISEQKKMEAALRESEERFRAIFEEAEVGIAAVSLSGSFLLANRKLAEIVQYSVEELLQKNDQDITHPEDLAKDLAIWEQINRGELFQFSLEKRYLRQNGIEVWVNFSGSLVRNTKGEPQYIIGMIQDISEQQAALRERKQAEAILSSLCENTTLMMGVIELLENDIRHLWDNPATAKLLGYDVQHLKNKTCQQLATPENIIQLWLKNCYNTQETQKAAHFEYQHKTPTGEHWLSATICWVPGNFPLPRCCYVLEDITERKRTEETLRHTTQNLLESQRIAHLGNWDFHVITQKMTCSEEVFRILGLDPGSDEPSLEEWVEMIHPDDREHHHNILQHSLNTGEYFDIEYRLLHPDGELRYLHTQGEVIQNEQNQAIRLFGVVIDRTEQKLAEEALCASEARYRALVEQMPAVVYTVTVGEASMPLYISPRIEQILGYTSDEWMSNPQLWCQCLHPDDREQMSRRLENLPSHNRPFVSEYRLLTRNQDVLWVQDAAVVIRDEDQTPILLQGVMLDITERKHTEVALRQSEERFSSLIRNLSVGVTLHNAQGEVLLCNPKAWQLLGLSEGELLGITCLPSEWKIIYEDGSPFPYSAHPVPQAIVTRQAVKNVLMGIYRPGVNREERELIWILVNAEPQLTAEGTVENVICTFSDITILKQVQEDLRTSEQLYRTIAHNFPNGTIFLFDQNLRYLVADGQGLASLQLRREQLEGYTLSEALSSEIYISVEPLYQTALAGSERVEEIEYEDQIYLIRAVPIRNEEGDVILGMIVSQNITEQKQVELALQRANHNLAEINQRLEKSVQELEQRHRESAIINQMIEFLQACHGVEEAYGPISEFLKQLFPGCAGAVLLSDQKANKVESMAAFGELAVGELSLDFDECWALRRGQIHLANRNQSGLFCSHVHQDPLPSASLCIPTIVQGQVFGLLYLRTQQAEGLSKGQQQLAQTVAEQISLGLSNLQLREELHNQSIRDPLTGLFNRRYLKEFLQKEVLRSQRSGQPLGIIMVDIDHFKQFNDSFGHEAGDLVLQEVARFLQRKIRLSDIACRYGGEEMTLILPEMSLEAVQARANQLCDGIRQLELSYQGKDLGRITASFGVACFPDQGLTPEAVIKKADEALYQAKNQGRNQVVSA